jgi:hypothetical protein
MSVFGYLRDRRFDGYLRRRLPHELDRLVDAAVAAYRSGSTETRQAMTNDLGPRVAGVLSAYGERMAAMAVRTRSAEPLRRGLVAMGVAEEHLDDSRTNLIVLGAVNHSAKTIGTDLATIIDDVAADLPARVLGTFRTFDSRSERDKSLQAMGLGTQGVGDSFRYVPA